jgi:hypothetical protein
MFKMEYEVDDEVVDQWRDVLSQLEDFDTKFSGVKLIGARDDGREFEVIVDSLIENGRDFFTPDSKIAEDVARAFAAEVEKRAQAAFKRRRRAIRKATRTGSQLVAAKTMSDDAIAGAALREGMKAYMMGVMDRLSEQRTSSGGAPDSLTPEYAAYKEKRWGFVTPIGVASGQLLASLIPGGATSGKIRLIRKGRATGFFENIQID